MVSCHDDDHDPDPTRDQTLLQIKQESKFFSRLLSKESSRANSSSRDRVLLYYGGAAGAIPFVWESRPGTPKHALSDAVSLVPPLTPPPSYQSRSVRFNRSASKPTVLIGAILFPARKNKNTRNKRTHVTSPSSSSGSSTSSFWSSESSPFYFKSNPESRTTIRYEDDYGSSLKSRLMCYGDGRRQRSDWRRLKGCFPVARVIKSALLSLVGRGSSGQGGGARDRG